MRVHAPSNIKGDRSCPTFPEKTALVTGASRGIGRASALALAAAGAQVLVHYGRGADEADAVVGEIRKAGGRGDAVAGCINPKSALRRPAISVRQVIAFEFTKDVA
jgi:3-oxoacyl-[acyl-carrier protein] reductase